MSICAKFLFNNTINPRTGRKIKPTGNVFKKLMEECGKGSVYKKHDIMVVCDAFVENPTVNPRTGRKITQTGAVFKNLVKECEAYRKQEDVLTTEQEKYIHWHIPDISVRDVKKINSEWLKNVLHDSSVKELLEIHGTERVRLLKRKIIDGLIKLHINTKTSSKKLIRLFVLMYGEAINSFFGVYIGTRLSADVLDSVLE